MNINELKNKILQLAIQGKLVKQNPDDEPVGVLLERIAEERKRLIKEKKIKREKPLPEITDEEELFELPKGWKWVRFGEIVSFNIGKTPPRKDKTYWDNAHYPWVSISDMVPNGKIKETKEYINENSFNNIFKGKISPKGTLLMSFKLTVGRVSILDIEAFHNEAIISIYPFSDKDNIIQQYLFKVLPLLSQYGNSKSAIKGNTLNSNSINELLIPLPSVAEQQRIVKKVDELFAIIDELAENKEEMLKNISNTRNKVLQLAIQGKLVEQNPNDTPASALLEEIRKEKEQLIKEKKIKKEKPLPEITEEEKPFELPKGWEWVRLGNIINVSAGKNLTKKEMCDDGDIPVYGGNGITGFHNDFNVSEKTVVIGRVGFYCGSVHLTEEKAWITDNAFITKYNKELVIQSFLILLLKRTNLKGEESSTAQPVISGKKIYPLVVALPSVAEQLRIVQKVDEIMAYLDELEKTILNDNII